MAKNEAQLLRRLELYRREPEVVKPLDSGELAELLLIVLDYIKSTDKNVKAGVLKGEKGDPGRDGKPLVPGKDYMTLHEQKVRMREMFERAKQEIRDGIDGKDGKDAEVTEEQIQEAAERAFQMIQLPNFEALITQEPQAIRDALELLQDDERLDAKAIKGLEDELTKIRNATDNAMRASVGGTNKNWVNQRVSQIRLEELANVYVSDTAPASPQVGDFWFDIS